MIDVASVAESDDLAKGSSCKWICFRTNFWLIAFLKLTCVLVFKFSKIVWIVMLR